MSKILMILCTFSLVPALSFGKCLDNKNITEQTDIQLIKSFKKCMKLDSYVKVADLSAITATGLVVAPAGGFALAMGVGKIVKKLSLLLKASEAEAGVLGIATVAATIIPTTAISEAVGVQVNYKYGNKVSKAIVQFASGEDIEQVIDRMTVLKAEAQARNISFDILSGIPAYQVGEEVAP